MLTMVTLALRSAWNRRFTLLMALLSIALSVTLLVGVERVRHQARAGFEQSVSGTDLIVGARTGPVQLLLYAVFRLGGATNNISWSSVEMLRQQPAVAWAVPLSLGDSHRGYPVVATEPAYFTHFRYGEGRTLALREGRVIESVFDVVLGADVARALGYRLGDTLALTHGNALAGPAHADKPFTVTGILQPTGTPVDRSLHITLAGMEAIHLDWVGGAPLPGLKIPAAQVAKFNLQPREVTAVLVGLKNRAAVFRLQRTLAQYREEPLLAVLPGVALSELWQVVGTVEKALLAVSALVVAVGLAGLMATLLAGLNERRRELAILRALGAGPRHVFCLLLLEGVAVSVAGMLLGMALLTAATAVAAPWVQARWGLVLPLQAVSRDELAALAAIVAVSVLASLVPGWRAYRLSLADGLVPRV